MVDVLEPSFLHEQFPAEIDVYRVPHNRMKQLVSSISEKLPEIQESLNYEEQQQQTTLESTLENIYSTVWELKTHEIIENTVIMNKLKERLHARQIYNQSVCNCHEDSDLIRIIDLVEMVYSSADGIQRNFYWQNLQEALYEFLDDFLPHMEEEENTFQPLLNEYFNYEELKQIQETVILQHEEWKEKVTSEKSLKRFKRDSESSEVTSIDTSEFEIEFQGFNKLPEETIYQIFAYFDDPRDLASSSQVCRRWNKVSKSSQFWRNLPLSQWERKIWKWKSSDLLDLIEMDSIRNSDLDISGDPVIYDNIIEQLNATGSSVKRLSVSGSKTLTNMGLREILKKTPNLRELDCSYTNLCHAAFNEDSLSLDSLHKIDLSGCPFVTDSCVQMLMDKIHTSSVCLKWVSFSGCELVTDKSLDHLQKVAKSLSYADFSGCHRISGPTLRNFITNCPNIDMENVSYCDYTQDGPDPSRTNGCQNTQCDIRLCCSNYQN